MRNLFIDQQTGVWYCRFGATECCVGRGQFWRFVGQFWNALWGFQPPFSVHAAETGNSPESEEEAGTQDVSNSVRRDLCGWKGLCKQCSFTNPTNHISKPWKEKCWKSISFTAWQWAQCPDTTSVDQCDLRQKQWRGWQAGLMFWLIAVHTAALVHIFPLMQCPNTKYPLTSDPAPLYWARTGLIIYFGWGLV